MPLKWFSRWVILCSLAKTQHWWTVGNLFRFSQIQWNGLYFFPPRELPLPQPRDSHANGCQVYSKAIKHRFWAIFFFCSRDPGGLENVDFQGEAKGGLNVWLWAWHWEGQVGAGTIGFQGMHSSQRWFGTAFGFPWIYSIFTMTFRTWPIDTSVCSHKVS